MRNIKPVRLPQEGEKKKERENKDHFITLVHQIPGILQLDTSLDFSLRIIGQENTSKC